MILDVFQNRRKHQGGSFPLISQFTPYQKVPVLKHLGKLCFKGKNSIFVDFKGIRCGLSAGVNR